MELPNGEMANMSLIQPMHRGGFAEDDLFILGTVAPFLAAVFKRYWRTVRPSFLKEASATAVKPPRRLGGRALSDREREVAYLILKGHSTPSMSLHLNISVTTVKTHRKNLYAKLGIASHYQVVRHVPGIHRQFVPSARSGNWDHPPLAGWDRRRRLVDT